MTRVSLDVTSVPRNPAGAGRYVYELARHLAMRSEVDLLPVSRKADMARWQALSDSLKVMGAAPDNRPLRLLWEQFRLPKVLDGLATDVHHGPHYTMPERTNIPTVVTIHDMTLFDHPEWHEKAKVKFFQRAIEKATKKAAGLIAVSNDTADRLKERFGSDLDVAVVHHGVDHDRFNTTEGESDRALLKQFDIPQRYVAFVGTLEPRKDVPTLLAAFDRIAPQLPDTYLVLAGGSGWHHRTFTDAHARMQYRSRVLQTGFLPDAVIPPLLRNALAVAYPSLTEGFGLPALEALACGAPLVTTKGSAMQEVVGDAALLIEPGDVEALSNALLNLINDTDRADELKAKGPQIASNFTWDASAAGHEAVYNRVAKTR